MLRYQANEVNLVLGTSDGKPAKIRIVRDPSATPQDDKKNGDDKTITVDSYKMYNLLNQKKHEQGELRIYSNSDNLQAYAFTFSGCEHK